MQNFRVINGKPSYLGRGEKMTDEMVDPVIPTGKMEPQGYTEEFAYPINNFNRLVATRNKRMVLGKPIDIPSRPYYVNFARPIHEHVRQSYVV